MRRALILLALPAMCQSGWTAAAPCRAPTPLILRVRFLAEAPREVVVESMLPSGFRLVDGTSREELWSTGPDPARTQQVDGMDSSFGTSFAALHLDADGLHDRLYAGDRAGRLWRFDLHAGARRSDWMEAAVLADLGTPGGGRGFVAKPDVALIEAPTGTSWFSIAIGTANTGAPRADNRFYVLRDSTTGRPGRTLSESDLTPLSPPAGVDSGNDHGYYLQLGSAQVLAQALTLNGRIHFTAVERPRALVAACPPGTLPDTPATLTVTVLRARDGAVEANPTDPVITDAMTLPVVRRALANPLPAATGVDLATARDPATGLLPCMIGAEVLPGCFLDLHPQRSWWRREDAD
jgi:hypothetical protein